MTKFYEHCHLAFLALQMVREGSGISPSRFVCMCDAHDMQEDEFGGKRLQKLIFGTLENHESDNRFYNV